MEFDVAVHRISEGWEVRIVDRVAGQVLTDPATNQPLARRLRHTAPMPDDRFGFPLPPANELDEIADAEVRRLCADQEGRDILDAYRQIADRQPRDRGVAHFGGYLFATLLGNRVWDCMLTAAAGTPVEVNLVWDETAGALERLPWEMMRTETRFLAAETGFAVVRRVANTAAIAFPHEQGAIIPRVLFVVGAAAIDEVVRPGAEYLGLLRRLRATNQELSLRTHLVLQASPEKLEAALKAFQPTVLHLICHGVVDAYGKAFLRFVSDQQGVEYEEIPAAGLLLRIRAAGSPPPIVVLNACNTATGDPVIHGIGQVSTPMAAELVRGGIPVVVGMAGAVADQACRLFTKRFYQALLAEEPVAQAASEGRGIGILAQGGDPDSEVDWALPTLFLAQGAASPRLRIDQATVEVERRWHMAAREFSPPAYPIFCDRFDLVEAFELLLADQEAQRALLSRSALLRNAVEVQCLALRVDRPDDQPVAVAERRSTERPQFGRTWMLQEIAARAARSGHLPVLVERAAESSANYENDLLNSIVDAVGRTVDEFGLEWDWQYFRFFKDLVRSSSQAGTAAADKPALPADFPGEIAESYDNWPDRSAVATALRLDLMALLEQARTTRREDADRTKLLLLFDDVHRLDIAADLLLNVLLDLKGLRAPPARPHVRIAFTYSALPAAGQDNAINKIIIPWLEKKSWATSVPLKEFRAPTEDRLAYEHFLLHWRDDQNDNLPRPLAVVRRASSEASVAWFFKTLDELVKGVPSLLKSPNTDSVIRMCLPGQENPIPMPPVLRDADDEHAMQLRQPNDLARGGIA